MLQMSNVRPFTDLKNVQIEYKKIDKGGYKNVSEHLEADSLL